MDRFEANGNQKKAIESLMYWIAELAFCKEGYGESEIKRSKDTVDFCLENCEKYGVPYWVQGEVIAYANDWRKYNRTYHRPYLAERAIYI